MKKLLFLILLIPTFFVFTHKAFAAETSYITGDSVTSTCGGSTMLTLDLSGFGGCVPYWEDPSTFSVDSFDISSIPNAQDLQTVTVKFWVNNTNNDSSVHYTPQLTVTAGCVVSGNVIEPTSSVWEEVTRIFDISSCNLTSATDSIQKIQITRNNTSGAGAIDYVALKVTYYASSYDLNDRTSNGNSLAVSGVTAVGSDLPFASSSHASDFETSSSQKLTAPDSNSLSVTGPLTIETWVKFESLPTNGEVMALAEKFFDSGNQRSYGFRLWNDGGTLKLRFAYSSDGTYQSANDVATAWTPSTGVWYHVAVALDTSVPNVKFYVNGSQQGSTITSNTGTAIYNSTSSLYIGGLQYSLGDTFFLDGVLDDTRIWNVARTSTEVNDNKSVELTGTESGLIAYYPFESRFEISDKTSNGNNLANNGASAIENNLPFGNSSVGADLEATDSDYIQAADSTSLSISGDFTIEAWINPESNASVNELRHYVSKSDDNISGYSFNQYQDNGTLKMGLVVGNGSTVEVLRITHSPTVGEWHHYAVTWKASTKTMELFKDGVSLGTVIGSSVSSIDNNSLPLRIGAAAYSNERNYDGQMDEVRIWNTVRTQAQISANYSGELTGSESGLAAYYPFESFAVSASYDLNDKSSNGNNLTNYGTTDAGINSSFGESSHATDFESSSSQKAVASDSNSLSQQSPLTIEAWVKFESLPSSGQAMSFVEKFNDTGNQRSYGFRLWNDSGTNKLRFVYSTDGTYQSANDVATAWSPSVDVWYHVAVVLDPSTPNVKFYVNGSQQGSTITSNTGTAIYNSTSSLYLGALQNSGGDMYFLDGMLDDIRIWNVVRTASQVNENKGVELTGSVSSLAAYYPLETL